MQVRGLSLYWLTYAKEDRSYGRSGGNIILHQHALLDRQDALLPDGDPPLLVPRPLLKSKVLVVLAAPCWPKSLRQPPTSLLMLSAQEGTTNNLQIHLPEADTVK